MTLTAIATNQALNPSYLAYPVIDGVERQRIIDFLTYEAWLADESRYAEWEALVDDDMIYWVPRGEGDFDMNIQMSIICDNRSRLHTRIAQLLTGERHAQVALLAAVGMTDASQTIAGALEQQAAAAAEIVQAAMAASSCTQGAAQAMDGIRQATRETTQAAEQVLGTTDQMDRRVGSLQSTIETFLRGVQAA